MYTIFKSLFIKVREVEIGEYLWDIMQLENSNIRQLYERTGISKIKRIHFFKSDYKKGAIRPRRSPRNRFIESRNSDYGAYRRILLQQAARNPRFGRGDLHQILLRIARTRTEIPAHNRAGNCKRSQKSTR